MRRISVENLEIAYVHIVENRSIIKANDVSDECRGAGIWIRIENDGCYLSSGCIRYDAVGIDDVSLVCRKHPCVGCNDRRVN